MLTMIESVDATGRKDEQVADKMRKAVKCSMVTIKKRKLADENHTL